MITDGTIRYHDTLQALLEPIDAVTPHPQNPNNGDLDEIEASIDVNGMYRPIYAQRSTGYILAGNHTWMALASRGAQQVPVLWLDIDDDVATRILLGDNAIAARAIRDNALTRDLLRTLAATEHGLHGTGYSPADLDVIEALAKIPLETNEHATWPTLSFTVHPKLVAAFRQMTHEATTDPERFEVLLRLAGWDGT
jgi:ParB-like chromosome segregation protein Spo0J